MMSLFFHLFRALLLAILLLLQPTLLSAQERALPDGVPITISVFSHAVSLPDFRGFFKNPNLGVRIGTEIAYGRNDASRFFQGIHLGYYHHDGFQQGIFAGTELGWRRSFGNVAADVTIGGNYLHLISELQRYEPSGDTYRPASQRMHKFMPSIGVNLAYRLPKAAVFLRYEAFGEIPFNFKGVPVLPHKALHVGTRVYPF